MEGWGGSLTGSVFTWAANFSWYSVSGCFLLRLEPEPHSRPQTGGPVLLRPPWGGTACVSKQPKLSGVHPQLKTRGNQSVAASVGFKVLNVFRLTGCRRCCSEGQNLDQSCGSARSQLLVPGSSNIKKNEAKFPEITLKIQNTLYCVNACEELTPLWSISVRVSAVSNHASKHSALSEHPDFWCAT